MRTNGNIIHCDVDFLAGQKKDANGNAGFGWPDFGLIRVASFLGVPPFFLVLDL